MSAARPICVLVAALGGQGGGVLADWLVAAAHIDGLKAQATSIPGVAQRTGATTYYFEVYPQRELGGRPVFSIYPASGAVDLVVSFEPMEAARALAGGHIGRETTVITARDRIYSTAEKIRPGDGTVATAPVLSALKRCAGTLKAVDMAPAARRTGCHPNAVMFGAMVATGVLPVQLGSCRQAIVQAGVSVEKNLAGFEVGRDLAAMPVETRADSEIVFKPAPDAFQDVVAVLPLTVQQMAGHAAAHLLDFQGPSYVDLFFERLGRVVAADKASQDYRLSVVVARRLAAWMAFEDVIRVAELKTRPGRLARIRRELGVGDDVPLTVVDYLKPGRDELAGILPARFDRWLPSPRTGKHRSGIAVKLKTSGPLGWLALRLLAALKSRRPGTARFQQEQEMIERWLQSVSEAVALDYDLACNTADLAVWARGYGDVRRRGFDRMAQVFADWPQRLAADRSALSDAVSTSLVAAISDPDAEVTR